MADIYKLSQEQISRSIGFARIFLIIGLVFIHYDVFPNVDMSPFQGFDPHAHPIATWVTSTILFFFYSVVPLLSLISGWLFFSRLDDTLASIAKRIRRRFFSLYLPLVGWNALYLAGMYFLFSTDPGHPVLKELNVSFASAGWWNYLNAVFALAHRPIGFQFWFVRDLFVTILLSPVWWFLLRRAPWVGALLLGAAWFSDSHLVVFFRTDVPFFFYMGALIRRKQLPISMPLPAAVVLVVFYVALAGLRALAPAVVHFEPDNNAGPLWLDLATHAMRIVGVMGCWNVIYRAAQTRWGAVVAGRGGLAFFLHSAHWPLLAFIKLWLWPLLPAPNDAWMLAHYVVCVGLTVAAGIGLGIALAHKAPHLFALMNGGRLLDQAKPSAQTGMP